MVMFTLIPINIEIESENGICFKYVRIPYVIPIYTVYTAVPCS